MKFEVDVHHYVHTVHDESRLLKLLLEKVNAMAVDLTNLTNAVAAQKTVFDSAITYIQGVPAQTAALIKQALIDAGVADAAAQAAADAAATQIQQETDAVQAALTANTPTPPVTP